MKVNCLAGSAVCESEELNSLVKEGESGMINSTLPDSWRDLQDQVAQIFEECGFETEVEKRIETVRGTVDIDVFAEDASQAPPVIYLCECKYWQSAVPKSVVHALRTVTSDFGANWGFIISSAGFQSGAYEAAKHSNTRLFTWEEFQEIFADRWFERYMVPLLAKEADPLVEYTEPFNSRISRKAGALSKEAQAQFRALQEEYLELAFLALPMYVPGIKGYQRPQLPIHKTPNELPLVKDGVPDDVLEATALREFLELYLRYVKKGVTAFDLIFGERA